MTVYISSDLHFGHKKIREYCPQFRSRFSTIEEMDQALIAEWNSKVKPGDQIYFLGDMCFYRTDSEVNSLLYALQGNIIWVKGNHDHSSTLKLARKIDRYTIKDVVEMRHSDNNLIVMTHFPQLIWNKNHYGSVHFHGHCHSSIEKHNADIRRTDCGWDVTGHIMTLEEAYAKTMKKPIKTVEGDHHNTERAKNL